MPERAEAASIFKFYIIYFCNIEKFLPFTAMLLTPEQRSIIQSTGNIKINAVAGSGKTTTVIE
ncbi:MAG: hypothetical protein KAZ27_16615, partial [Saprospiraceae bacterium]|nr:hypothetical protein [Saprospiraceae bacterium]